MSERGTSEGWAEYRRLVIAALERYALEIDSLKKDGAQRENRLSQLEKLVFAIRNDVFGDADAEGVHTRLVLLEKFVREHPGLTYSDPDAPSERKIDKRMLVLLVGAIGGLIGVLKMAFEVILKVTGN
mgnify:CR=1 FL=1